MTRKTTNPSPKPLRTQQDRLTCAVRPIAVLTAVFALCVAAAQHERADDTGRPDRPSALAPDSVVGDELRALVTDVAAHRLCERLRGRFLALSAGGAAVQQGIEPVDGNLLIRECTAERVDAHHLRLEISGVGWRWIARSRQRFEATFEIDEYLKAAIEVSTAGAVDFAYDTAQQMAMLELIPIEPVEIGLDILNDVEVKAESIWASIVGTGVDIVGTAPRRRAMRALRRRGRHRLEARVSHGLTVVVDLCTGQRYLKFGTASPEAFRAMTTPSARRFLVHASAVLHEGGMLFAGPFETDEPVVASIEVLDGGAVRASYVCEQQAQRLADAYVKGDTVPAIEQSIAEQTVRGDAPVSLTVGADVGCRLVLVMRGPKQQREPVTFTYTVTRQNARARPWVDCE
ncbi:MAG: hypothetical protein GF331_25335 [Chitinivibrionales bacterium]|nr:hypothetical protein [Chitinivibrionales bacterium]